MPDALPEGSPPACVAGDHRLGAKAEAGQEHLHLLGGGVLRLVEDHEGVVERAPAHEGERRHFDRAALDQVLRAIDVISRAGRHRAAADRG